MKKRPTDEYARERSLARLHCLLRVEKLKNRLEQHDWGMNGKKEVGLLLQMQAALSLMLHDIGVECYVIDDLEIAEQLEQPS